MQLDAYTVRKAVPRILLAVIGINLSIYFCLAAVDIVEVVAKGIASILTGPFTAGDLNSFGVKTDKTNAIASGTGIYLASGPMLAASDAAFAAVAAEGFAAVTGALSSLFFLLIPIILLVVAILVTVVIRQALLFFLIVSSPVAIACFILPGTEKYFQKWWDLFLKTLLVYPIITTIFAVSDIFASIIFSNNEGGAIGIAKIVTGIIVIFAPVFMIPFAFKFAGGAVAALLNAASGMGDRAAKSGFVKNRQQYYGEQNRNRLDRGRVESYRRATENASRGGIRGFAAGRRSKRLTGYKADILAKEAAMNEQYTKQMREQTGNGDDTDWRAYTVNKARADRARAAGVGQDDLWRDHNGVREYRTAGGKWVSSADVDRAQQRFGARNTGALQQALTYEMGKATEEGQQQRLVDSYGSFTQDWNMSGSERVGTWIGPAFNNQQEDLAYKHTSFDANGNATVNDEAYTREVYEKKGPQMLAYLKGRNVKQLREAHANAVDRLNTSAVGTQDYTDAQTELKMHESIMDTLASSQPTTVGTPGAPAAPGAPAGGTAIVPPPAGGGGTAGAADYGWTTGSGHTTDELKQYFSEVKKVAQQREQLIGGGTPANNPLTNPYRGRSATTPSVESQAAEQNPNRNRERL